MKTKAKMQYAIVTYTSNQVKVARKGWTNARNNEKIRADVEQYSDVRCCVICEFDSREAADAYAATLK